jgi:hypothetical protein
MTTSIQILLWTVSSILFATIWFKYIKPKMALSNRGEDARQSAIGQSGVVTKLGVDATQGVIRFSTPVMDKDEWDFKCKSKVDLGDRLYIESVTGDSLQVVTSIN